jgi:peroxiredoxin family protein
MNLLGLGRWMVKKRIKAAGVEELYKLMSDFRELGGKIIVCKMTMEIMGISRSDLREDLIDEFGAVGTYVNEAKDSKITLFI